MKIRKIIGLIKAKFIYYFFCRRHGLIFDVVFRTIVNKVPSVLRSHSIWVKKCLKVLTSHLKTRVREVWPIRREYETQWQMAES